MNPQKVAYPDECASWCFDRRTIFLILVLDHPFSGWFKVSSEPFEIMYQQLMK